MTATQLAILHRRLAEATDEDQRARLRRMIVMLESRLARRHAMTDEQRSIELVAATVACLVEATEASRTLLGKGRGIASSDLAAIEVATSRLGAAVGQLRKGARP